MISAALSGSMPTRSFPCRRERVAERAVVLSGSVQPRRCGRSRRRLRPASSTSAKRTKTRSAERRRDIFPDVIGADRQLAMAAIDQAPQTGCAPGRPKSESASIAARQVRPVKATSSTRMIVRPSSCSGRCVAATGERLPAQVKIVAMHGDIDRARVRPAFSRSAR